MDPVYQRYVDLVRAAGKDPTSQEAFLAAGLYSVFLDYERRSAVYQVPVTVEGFSRYIEALRRLGDEEKAWQSYIKSRTRKPRKPRKNPLKKTPVTQADIVPPQRPAVSLTEQQQREVNLALHYQANMTEAGFRQWVILHGYNPLERYR